MRALFALFVLFASSASAEPIESRMIANTGPYECDELLHTEVWTNETGRELAIKKASVWTGVIRGGKADVAATLIRVSDGAILVDFGWDHYVDPTGPHTMIQDFAPDWMALAPGDALRLQYFCDDFGRRVKAHHTSVVWWNE